MGKLKQTIKDAGQAVYNAIADMPTAEASQLQPAVDGATAVVEKVAKAVRKEPKTAEERKQATTGIMQLGKKDGITVSADVDSGLYLVELPNKYEMTYQLKGMERIGFKPNPDPKVKLQNAIYAMPVDKLTNEGLQKDFMNNVASARRINAAMTKEFADMTSAIEFNFEKESKPFFTGIPITAKRDENNQVVRKENNEPVKTPGFVKGEVLNVGEYYVAIRALGNDPTTRLDVKTNKVHMIETSRFLTGEDYKNTAVARKDSVLSHMKIDAAKVKFIDGQTFGAVEKGTTKYMSFDEKGKVKEINAAYNKAVTQAKKEESKVTQAPTKKAELAI